ncbi:MAG: hypothetical protein WB696_09965 [Chthoniobacterales bacterium]
MFFPAELREESIERLENADSECLTAHWHRHKHLRTRQRMVARNAVHYRIRAGYMERPKVCAGCGRKTAVEAHHLDYAKPLEAQWLCRDCHIKEEAL